MTLLTRIVLDVLKPHVPNALGFAKAIADNNSGCQVTVTVVEVDEKTESTMVTIEGNEIEYEQVVDAVTSLGASVHSIDEVTVSNKTQSTD